MTTSIFVAGMNLNIVKADAATANETSIGGMGLAVESYYNERLSESGISISNITTPILIEGERLKALERVSPFDGLAFSNTEDYVNIRSSWNTESDVVGKLYRGAMAQVLVKGQNWTKIKSGSVEGYILNDYLVYDDQGATKFENETITKKIKATCVTLNVREGMNTDAKIKVQIGEHEQKEIVKEYDDWFEILISNDNGVKETGFVHKDYVDVVYQYKKAISKEEEEAKEAARQEEISAQRPNRPTGNTSSNSSNSSGSSNSGNNSSNSSSSGSSNSGSSNSTNTGSSQNSSLGNKIANFALQFVGNPYRWGGTSLNNGADCSGFVSSIYKNYGYSIPRTSSDQARGAGRSITPSYSNLQAGDLLFYGDRSGRVNHVALYTGDGRVVHASNYKDGIKTNRWNYRTPLYARRVIN
jgi:cell wall-associated NlpC family hydrolase